MRTEQQIERSQGDEPGDELCEEAERLVEGALDDARFRDHALEPRGRLTPTTAMAVSRPERVPAWRANVAA